MITPLNGSSLDIAAEKRAQLKQLCPTAFTETKNEKGEIVEAIDFEKLKAELGTFSEFFDARRERYGMDWPGKKDALRLIQTPSYATLKPCREESVNFDTTENLFIEGDNLEVLKILQKSYYNKVKMIYIDPPYNTGNEFIYPDNYTEDLSTYLEYAGLISGDGKKFSTNTTNEGRFHTKWLNMMYPRLYLARNLLKDDGVIFISIDDHEVSNLRKLCDEIFGEENFVAVMVWERAYSPKNDAKYISNSHDYVLMYVRVVEKFEIGRLPRTEEANARYSNPDNDPRGVWKTSDLSAKRYTPSDRYPITTPSGRIVEPPTGRSWRLSTKAFAERLADNRIWFGKNGDSIPQLKRFLSELRFEGMAPQSILFYKDVGHSQEGAQEVTTLLESGSFDGPKPKRLLSRLLILANMRSDDIAFDFFSGSATTAHAVMQLNSEDGGNRKFIMVQLPEKCDETSEAFKAGYKTIAEIGKERIRRVIKKIKSEKEVNDKKVNEKGLYDEENDSANAKPLDLGFKVLKLDQSNFKKWLKLEAKTPVDKIEGELLKYVDHINPGVTQEDLLYEILLKAGFQPTVKIELLEFKNGKLTSEVSKNIDEKTKPPIRLFSAADGGLLLCLEDHITKEIIEAVVELPTLQQFICLDSAFHGNDQLKANAVQTFAARNMKKDKHEHIIFKTV